MLVIAGRVIAVDIRKTQAGAEVTHYTVASKGGVYTVRTKKAGEYRDGEDVQISVNASVYKDKIYYWAR